MRQHATPIAAEYLEVICSHADWVEHVLATGGDQYLKTPEHLLPWHVRHMLDVYAFVGALLGGLAWLSFAATRSLFGGRQKQVRQDPCVFKGWRVTEGNMNSISIAGLQVVGIGP